MTVNNNKPVLEVVATDLRGGVDYLLTCSGGVKHSARTQLLEKLQSAIDLQAAIDVVLTACIESGLPGRLDVAVDVLSQMGNALLSYTSNRLRKAPPELNRDSESARGTNADYWYVLLRAVAQTNVDCDQKYQLIAGTRDATDRGIREALVEALGDLGGERAKHLLQEIATTDSDPFIQRLATEALEDLDEE